MREALNIFQPEALIRWAGAAILAAMFDLIAPRGAPSPVIVSVPHAGRDYPRATIAALRVPPAHLRALEDRHVDRIALAATDAGAALLIARTPRAVIDLNRAEEDVDEAMIRPLRAGGRMPSTKVRGGLGLVPRRLSGVGDLWRDPLDRVELDRRIAAIHRPYHAALGALIADRVARFGSALLIDLHSMPPLPPIDGEARPRIILGDRFGRAAGGRFTARLRATCESHGLPVAENVPYPGGHLIERHAAPGRGVHAVQVEVDRSLYLAPGLVDPDPAGIARLSGLIRALCAAGAEEALAAWAIAAE